MLKENHAVHDVEREPGQDKQSQNQSQGYSQIPLFLHVVLGLSLETIAWFLSEVSSNGIKDIAVENGHDQQGYQSAEEEVEVNQIGHGDHCCEVTNEGRAVCVR